MATEVKIPPLGESISSGILSKWLVKSGDVVKTGQVIFEFETDKITSEGTAETSGQITLKVKEGEEVAIGGIVAEIDSSVTVPAAPAAPVTAPSPAVSGTCALMKGPKLSDHKKDTPSVELKEVGHLSSSGKVYPPSVLRIAEENGLNPDTVKGTGKDGRVTKFDMITALEQKQSSRTAPVPPSQPKQENIENKCTTDCHQKITRKKLSPLRRKIAERLVNAQHQAALLTTFNEVDMHAVMSIRKKYQDQFVKIHGVKLGFMSFFVKAVVKALKEIPQLNAQIEGDEIIENHYYDVGVAVGSDKGLFVPVVRDCDKKSMAQIELDIINYAKKARDGKISLEDMQGGVFTITNGGIYGSMLSTPIINAPQSGILGMHSIKDRAVVVDGQIVIRPMMYLALTYDHRIVDGKEAVTFLTKVKDALEDPNIFLLSI